MQETPVPGLGRFLGWKIPWRRDRLPMPGFLGFPGGSGGKESACNAGDLGLMPGLGRSPGKGKGHPFQYSGLENSTQCIIYGITKSRTQLRDSTPLHFTLVYKEASLSALPPPGSLREGDPRLGDPSS